MPDRRGDEQLNDPLDERIRALLTRAVAEAPPAPSPGEIDVPGLPAEVIRLADPPPRPAAGRSLLAVAASVAVALLVAAGALAVGRLGEPSEETATQGERLAVRYVPAELPPGLLLTGVESSAPTEPDPVPQVSVFEGGEDTNDGANDEVTVRITVGPGDWADGTASTTAPPSSATPDTTTPPGTVGPTSSVGAGTSTTTTLAPTTSTTTATTTTTAGPGRSSLPGLPARWGIVETPVRGGPGGIELHDPDTTTVWFADEGRLVAVDVFGMGQDAALRLVDDLQPRADGTGFDPDPGGGFRRVAETPSTVAGSAAATPPTARLVFGDGALVVTNVQLASGRRDLLTAAAGSFGTLERWGDREVLLDAGLDGGAISQASFVDPDAGVLVTVRGPTGELQPYVEQLELVDERGWDRFVARHSASSDSTGPTTTGPDTTGPTSTVPT